MSELDELKASLKSKIGQRVKLLIHHETYDSTSGPFPHIDNEERWIVFLGIYGLRQIPLYIHGKDEDGKDNLFRDSYNLSTDEDTGRIIEQSHSIVQKLDDIDIESWFNNHFFLKDESEFKKRVEASEPDNKYLALRILEGDPHYNPAGITRLPNCFFLLEEPEFIEKVLAYLEKIV